MSIKHLIIHVVKRDKDGEPLTKHLRPKENEVKGLAAKLTDDLLALFSLASLSIGEFGVNSDTDLQPAFEQKLNQHYDKLKCKDFTALTKDLAELYEGILKHNQLNTVKGGYLVFYQYESRKQEWLGVAILNKTGGINVSDTALDVIPSQVLDLKKLHLGAAINLTQWQDGLSTRYIRFRTGLAAEVRDYFEEFIGCQRDKNASQIETNNLKDAVRNFARTTCKLDDDGVSQKLASTHDYITQKNKNGEEVCLSNIGKHVFPENNDDFVIHAREHYDLPEEIVIHKATLRSYKKITGKGNGLSISFDREMLGKQVVYENDTLLINEIPDSLREALEEEEASKTSSKT